MKLLPVSPYWSRFIEQRNRIIRNSKLLRALFLTSEYTVLIAQWPNIPLLVAIILWIESWFATGSLHYSLQIAYSTALIIWGLMEMMSGRTLFRKIMGIVVTLLMCLLLFHS